MAIKVLIVDDSALMRSIMTEIISSHPDLEVVGVAPDPLVARDLIKQLDPDVLTLDVEMPRMDGLDFLEKLMRLRPMPVIMVSSLTENGSDITLRALELGAIDYITKPKLAIKSGMLEYADLLVDKIKIAYSAKANIDFHAKRLKNKLPMEVLSSVGSHYLSSEKLIMVGASTGGTEAIKEFLMQMPSDCPGILITQHMPKGFTSQFAHRLDRTCNIRVVEATGGERILPGHAYIAPGDEHMRLAKNGANYIIQLDKEPPVKGHRPSVDVLFNSAAKYAGKNAVGVILTGMGKDGALGLLEMRKMGAYNFAQDQDSCIVFGMPREAIAIGAAHEVAPLSNLAGLVLDHFRKNEKPALRL
ncbi:MAG: chemotaxis response regulator protein-glutamate methylesterase [Methylococcales bacterium]|nr:MAG: chemotaxis response regulator protein-glutamate methylesterase [Methylococcales bacterium]